MSPRSGGTRHAPDSDGQLPAGHHGLVHQYLLNRALPSAKIQKLVKAVVADKALVWAARFHLQGMASIDADTLFSALDDCREAAHIYENGANTGELACIAVVAGVIALRDLMFVDPENLAYAICDPRCPPKIIRYAMRHQLDWVDVGLAMRHQGAKYSSREHGYGSAARREPPPQRADWDIAPWLEGVTTSATNSPDHQLPAEAAANAGEQVGMTMAIQPRRILLEYDITQEALVGFLRSWFLPDDCGPDAIRSEPSGDLARAVDHLDAAGLVIKPGWSGDALAAAEHPKCPPVWRAALEEAVTVSGAALDMATIAQDPFRATPLREKARFGIVRHMLEQPVGSFVRFLGLRSSWCPVDALVAAASSWYWLDRLAAAGHADTPEIVKTSLLDDSNRMVRSFAEGMELRLKPRPSFF